MLHRSSILRGGSAGASRALNSSAAAAAAGGRLRQPRQEPRAGVIAFGQARTSLHLPLDRDLEEPLEGFDRIADALKDYSQGKFLVVLDDESRENEGDLIMAADKMTTEAMAFMVEHTSGVVCIGMEGKDLDRLRLPLMVNSAENEDTMYTAFTVTVDLRDGITTGISAADRANSIRKLGDPQATAGDFRRPGHIFPLRCRPGGVLVRPGHTEASVDLARLAGCFPAGALCEIVNKPDGSMSRTPELLAFSARHGFRCIAIADLMRYRLRHEQLVTCTASATISSAHHGPLQVHTFRSVLDGAEHVALVTGSVSMQDDVPVHIHPGNRVADLLGLAPSSLSGTAPADKALRHMVENGRGVMIYMQHRGAQNAPSMAEEVQLLAAMQAHGSTAHEELPGPATADDVLDLCDYGLAAQILSHLQVESVCVASNRPLQRQALESCGLRISSSWEISEGRGNGHVSQEAKSNGFAKAATAQV